MGVRSLSSERRRPLITLVSHIRAPNQVSTITTLSYSNLPFCYSRTVAYCAGAAMLFSSGPTPPKYHERTDRLKCAQDDHAYLQASAPVVGRRVYCDSRLRPKRHQWPNHQRPRSCQQQSNVSDLHHRLDYQTFSRPNHLRFKTLAD